MPEGKGTYGSNVGRPKKKKKKKYKGTGKTYKSEKVDINY